MSALSPDDVTTLQAVIMAASGWIEGNPASREMHSAAQVLAMLSSAAWCLERLERASLEMPFHMHRVDEFRPTAFSSREAQVQRCQEVLDRYAKAKGCKACNGSGLVPMASPASPCPCQSAHAWGACRFQGRGCCARCRKECAEWGAGSTCFCGIRPRGTS